MDFKKLNIEHLNQVQRRKKQEIQAVKQKFNNNNHLESRQVQER